MDAYPEGFGEPSQGMGGVFTLVTCQACGAAVLAYPTQFLPESEDSPATELHRKRCATSQAIIQGVADNNPEAVHDRIDGVYCTLCSMDTTEGRDDHDDTCPWVLAGGAP